MPDPAIARQNALADLMAEVGTGDVAVTITDLTVDFNGRAPWLRRSGSERIRAVDGLNLAIEKGRTLSLVGESGSGKSTTARAILGLQRPTQGCVEVFGKDLAHLTRSQELDLRRQMQAVFQDPYASLNAFKTVGQILEQPLAVHRLLSRNSRPQRVAELLQLVGLQPHHAELYPRDFSGGQRQRIAIARALACEPRFVVLDEPLSSLDVSIQAQIVNLLADLKRRLGLTFLFIAHDLSVVREIADEIGVMYAGQLLERALCEDLFSQPLHPYTTALIAAVPTIDARQSGGRSNLDVYNADPSASERPAAGCPFQPRCPHARGRCREERPTLRVLHPGHAVACHFAEEIESGSLPRAQQGSAVGDDLAPSNCAALPVDEPERP